MSARKLQYYMDILIKHEINGKDETANKMLIDFITLLDKHNIDREYKRADKLFDSFVSIIKSVIEDGENLNRVEPSLEINTFLYR